MHGATAPRCVVHTCFWGWWLRTRVQHPTHGACPAVCQSEVVQDGQGSTGHQHVVGLLEMLGVHEGGESLLHLCVWQRCVAVRCGGCVRGAWLVVQRVEDTSQHSLCLQMHSQLPSCHPDILQLVCCVQLVMFCPTLHRAVTAVCVLTFEGEVLM